jgi:hypothetical protein
MILAIETRSALYYTRYYRCKLVFGHKPPGNESSNDGKESGEKVYG